MKIKDFHDFHLDVILNIRFSKHGCASLLLPHGFTDQKTQGRNRFYLPIVRCKRLSSSGVG